MKPMGNAFLLQNFNPQVLNARGATPTSAATHSIGFSGPQFEIEESCIAALFGWVQKAHAQDLRAFTELKFMDLASSSFLSSIGRTFSHPSRHNVRDPPTPLRD